ncbi:hypothetical protein HHL19_12695 [Streptomyces sp. R302]|uniref:hypothetical protein n=1 Tax=unclassified Streptomyces TaxID=2593676 RepID=UPI00145F833C|nr:MULTISPECIES: hypothetical protein [unclassified Streptomyces]NML50519.1 hypothetical protein [Streptomyces sp. R301]NML79510.1 hypothetical protein [Streptomyces sp. R302]
MADERYQWLDPDAAERLLRGEPVDPADPADPVARTGAAALADALDTVRVPAAPAPGVPLAGEEAALAAFRTATTARAAAAARTAAPGAARRWGRSLRYGLAAALAAVTVGGVAVAAGTGVLPLVDREPSRTATAADPAIPTGDPGEPTAGIERRPDPSRNADPDRPTTTPAPGTSPTAGPEDGTSATPRPGATPSGERSGERSGRDEGDAADSRDAGTREARTSACREYRAGRLDDAGRERLSAALRADESLRAYCDALLGPATEKADGGKADGGKAEDDAENGDQGKGGDRDEEGRETGTDLGRGTVPSPSDPSRKRGRGGSTDKPDPKDRPKAKPRAKTQVTAVSQRPAAAAATRV